MATEAGKANEVPEASLLALVLSGGPHVDAEAGKVNEVLEVGVLALVLAGQRL